MDTVTAHLALSPPSPSPLEESFWSSPPSPLNSEFYSSLTSLDLKERFSTVSSTYASRAARMGIFKDAAKLATRKSNDPQLVAFPPTDSKLPNSKAEDSVSSNDTSTSTPDPSASSSNSKTRPRKPKTKRSFAKFLDLAIQGATKLSEDSLASPPPLSSAGSDVSEFALVTPPLGPSEVTIEVVKDSEGGVEKPTIPPTQNQSPDTHIRWRGAIPHHCFPACDAPYMVSYSACALQRSVHPIVSQQMVHLSLSCLATTTRTSYIISYVRRARPPSMSTVNNPPQMFST